MKPRFVFLALIFLLFFSAVPAAAQEPETPATMVVAKEGFALLSDVPGSENVRIIIPALPVGTRFNLVRREVIAGVGWAVVCSGSVCGAVSEAGLERAASTAPPAVPVQGVTVVEEQVTLAPDVVGIARDIAIFALIVLGVFAVVWIFHWRPEDWRAERELAFDRAVFGGWRKLQQNMAKVMADRGAKRRELAAEAAVIHRTPRERRTSGARILSFASKR